MLSNVRLANTIRAMDYHISYEHSSKGEPQAFVGHVPSQLVEGVPVNAPRALLPQYIAAIILQRSPSIERIRNLRIL